VIGNECAATMKKTVNRSNEFRTNLARKGTAVNYELSEKERLFCLKVAQCIGSDGDTLGIDWMLQDGEPVLIEVNSNYGTKIIDIVGHNFFKDLFFHIELAVQDFKKRKKEKDDNQKEYNSLFQEIEILQTQLNKKEILLNELLENEKMKNLFRSLKGKDLGYVDSERNDKKIRISKPQHILEMTINMLKIQN
jgi:hypothetical protein